jgi:F-type H+-transporting ATPase subunit a
MPEHTSWLTLLLAMMHENLDQNAHALGRTFIGKREPGWQSFEPIAAALLVAVLLILMSLRVRTKLARPDVAVIPDDRLTLRTFMEAFLGYFYDLAKSLMGPERAKRHFPIVATSAVFVFFSNVLALIPGMPVATSHLDVTLGCGLVVFILFNFYGLRTNGWAYLKHMGGPILYMWPLVFVIELISLTVRPITLAVRLMVNMAVDHLLLAIMLGALALVLPIPIMVLGCMVVVIQTLVFTILTCIYVALATEHEEAH